MILDFDEYNALKESVEFADDNDMLFTYLIEQLSDQPVTVDEFLSYIDAYATVYGLNEYFDIEEFLHLYEESFILEEGTEYGDLVYLNENSSQLYEWGKKDTFDSGVLKDKSGLNYRSLTHQALDKRGADMNHTGGLTRGAAQLGSAIGILRPKKSFGDKVMGYGMKAFGDYNTNKAKSAQAEAKVKEMEAKKAERAEKAKRDHELRMTKTKGKYGMK